MPESEGGIFLSEFHLRWVFFPPSFFPLMEEGGHGMVRRQAGGDKKLAAFASLAGLGG